MIKFYVKEEATIKISDPESIYQEFKDLSHADQESMWVVGLNSANGIILKECLFLGGLNYSIVDPKLLFRRLLKAGCISFIIIHNHPAGSIKPSEEDNHVTRKIKDISKIIEIAFLDHIIIGEKGYYSYKTYGNIL